MEARRLLSTYAVSSGHSDVYIEGDNTNPGTVYVILDSRANTPVATFTGSANSITSLYSGITFHDESSAYQKQGMTINYTTGGSSTLEIDAGVNDTDIEEAKSLSGETVTVNDDADSATGVDGYSYSGGITALHLVANDAGGVTVNVPASAEAVTIDTGAGEDDTITIGTNREDGEVHDATVNTGAGNDSVTLVTNDDDGITTASVDFGNTPGAGNSLTVDGASSIAYLYSAQAIDNVTATDFGRIELVQTGRWNTNTFGTMTVNYGGVLDVGAQDVLVTDMSDSDVRTLIGYAYDGGDWAGSGITSSYAVGNPSLYAVGYATYSDGISGLGLSSGQVLIRPTTAGDTDLSGTTNFNDYLNLQNNYNHSGTDWTQGDFDYSGTTDYNDFLIQQNAYNHSFPT